MRNRNSCHRVTTGLIQRFGVIAIEDLRIGNMTRSARGTAETPGRNVRQKAGLNRSILEQSWGTIDRQLTGKAEWTGRQIVKVNPRLTSQRCSSCGAVRKKATAAERWKCGACGTEHDRDVNAAINIERAGILALASQSSGRAAA